MRKIAMVVVLMIALSASAPVHADVAPPAYPPGFNPAPGSEQTQVRMESETVRMNILEEQGGDELGLAEVSAVFNMKNLGTADETMAVRFPAGAGDGYFGVTPIQDISVKVDDRSVSVRNISGEDPNGFEESVPWVEFEVLFPVGKDVKVEVSYSLEATGEMPYIWFQYIFSTGSGWKGTIGSADLIVSFPYAVDELFLLPCIDSNYNCTVPGGVIDNRTITWQFRDFEPQPEDNFSIALAAPSVWSEVLVDRERVNAVPTDGETWGRLGMRYKSLVFSPHGMRGFRNWLYLADPGVEALFQLSDEAYAKATSLLPEDALWHAGYAELLGYYAEFAGYEGVDTLALKVKALEFLQRALVLAPEDETVREIAYGLTWPLQGGLVVNEGGFDFPWLTQTPVPTATQIGSPQPTETPALQVLPTKTLPPVQSATHTSAPAVVTEVPRDESSGDTKTPLCGGALLIPLLLMAGVKLFQLRGDRLSF